MRVKIVSNGTSAGTSVLNAETGELVEGVVAAYWSCYVGELAKCTILFEQVEVEVEGEKS